MKVSELTGALLDYWVARAEGGDLLDGGKRVRLDVDRYVNLATTERNYAPSIYWAQGGPIIEREKMYLRDPDPLTRHVDSSLDKKWMAAKANHGTREYEHQQFGETVLLATMRCYVASKYGDDLPDI